MEQHPHLTDLELKVVYGLAKEASERELGIPGERTGTRIVRLIDELLLLRADDRRQEARITELQETSTELVLANRVLASKVKALETILKHVLIDQPVAIDLATTMGGMPGAAIRDANAMQRLYERVSILEDQAATKCSKFASDFVQDVRNMFGDEAVDSDDDQAAWNSAEMLGRLDASFIANVDDPPVPANVIFWYARRWAVRFRKALAK